MHVRPVKRLIFFWSAAIMIGTINFIIITMYRKVIKIINSWKHGTSNVSLQQENVFNHLIYGGHEE